jgi:RNA polymerase sigma-70 factor (ECF subfamily)
MRPAMDEAAKYRWIGAHILPLEGEVRLWLRAHVRSLSAADIDDVIQESYARLWPAEFATIASPRAYFYRVVRNLVHELARHARVVPMELMGEIDALGVISDEPGPERRLSARQELDRLKSIVAELPPQCRKAFELRKFEGLSQRAIAARMGVSESTVEKHLAKALARLLEARAAGEGAAHDRASKPRRDRGSGHGED